MIRQLLRVGSEGVLTFEEKPNPFVRPRESWAYEVVTNESPRASFGDLTLLVRRGSDYPVKTIDSPTEGMLETSTERIFLLPSVSDVAPKRLVDCAARLLHGGEGMSEEKLAMIRKFVLGQDHTPDNVDRTLFDHALRNVDASKLLALTDNLDETQKGALHHIGNSPHLFKTVRGPPGTGKLQSWHLSWVSAKLSTIRHSSVHHRMQPSTSLSRRSRHWTTG